MSKKVGHDRGIPNKAGRKVHESDLLSNDDESAKKIESIRAHFRLAQDAFQEGVEFSLTDSPITEQSIKAAVEVGIWSFLTAIHGRKECYQAQGTGHFLGNLSVGL